MAPWWTSIRTKRPLRLYDGVPELLDALRRMGKGVYLLSNAQRIFTAYELNVLDIAGAAAVGLDTCYIRSNISPENQPRAKATYTLMEMDIARVRELLAITG